MTEDERKAEELRLKRIEWGRKGGLARVKKGFAKSGKAKSAGAKSKRRYPKHEEKE